MDTCRYTGFDHPHRGRTAVPRGAALYCTESIVIDIGKDTYPHRGWLSQHSFHELGRSEKHIR